MAFGMPPVVVSIIGNATQLEATLGKAKTDLLGFSGSTGKALGQVAKFGKFAALGVAAIAGASVDVAAKFQTQMALVRTQAGDTTDNIGQLSQSVLNMSGKVGQSPVKLAEALYHVASVGYRGADAMNVLKVAAQGAAVGHADLETTTYALTSLMNSLGDKAGKAGVDMATMNAIVGAGDMRMQDFASSIGTGFMSTAQTFGVSVQSAGAALAFMTDRGAHADEASTRLRMTLALLAAPSAKAAGLLKDIGLSGPEVTAATTSMTEALRKSGLTTTQLADDLRKPDGIQVALKHLQTALHNSGMSADAANALLAKSFGGGKSDATILAMLNNLDTLKGKFDTISKGGSTRAFQQDWAVTQKTFSQQMKQMGGAVEALGVRIGLALIPVLEKVIAVTSKVVGWLERHKTVATALGIAISTVLVTAMAAYAAQAAASAVATIAATWPILLIIAAVAAVAVGIYELVTHWRTVWTWIKQIVADAWHFLRSVFDTIVHVDLQILSTAVGAVRAVWSAEWTAIKTVVVTAWNILHSVINDIIGAGLWVIRSAIDVLAAEWGAVWHAITWAVQTAWSVISSVINGELNAGISTVTAVVNGLEAVWNGFWSGASAVVSAAWSVIQPIVDTIKSALSDVSSAASSITSIASTVGGAVSSVTGAVSSVTGAIGSMIPHLAKGGIVNGPTLALLGEGGEREFVIPESKLGPLAGLYAGQTPATLPQPLTYSAAASGGALAPAPTPAAAATTTTINNSPVVYAQTNADPTEIARELAWALKTGGGY